MSHCWTKVLSLCSELVCTLDHVEKLIYEMLLRVIVGLKFESLWLSVTSILVGRIKQGSKFNFFSL